MDEQNPVIEQVVRFFREQGYRLVRFDGEPDRVGLTIRITPKDEPADLSRLFGFDISAPEKSSSAYVSSIVSSVPAKAVPAVSKLVAKELHKTVLCATWRLDEDDDLCAHCSVDLDLAIDPGLAVFAAYLRVAGGIEMHHTKVLKTIQAALTPSRRSAKSKLERQIASIPGLDEL